MIKRWLVQWEAINWTRYIDKELMIVLTLLIGLGLAIMASASVAVADKNNYTNILYFLDRQIIFLCLGLFLALIIYQIRMGFWQDLGVKLLFLVVFLLIIVLIPGIGKEVNGSRRWISLGLFTLQISEIAKLITLMYLAGYMVRHGKNLATSPSYKPLLIPLGAMGFIGALLLLEPDFGTMLVVMASSIALLFLGGVRIRRLLLVILGSIAVMIPFLMMGYRGSRMMAFLDPWSYASGTGYQTIHALMAIGNGGWFGTGLGGGVLKLYVPEPHNDYIFSILAEEFGFVGIVVVLFLFAWLVKRAFVIGFNADKVKQHYSAYLAYGIGFWIGFQALFHIGVNMALLPPKGLTLPFISYGGSSLLIACIAMGLLMRIHRETQFALYGGSTINQKPPFKKTKIKTKISRRRTK